MKESELLNPSAPRNSSSSEKLEAELHVLEGFEFSHLIKWVDTFINSVFDDDPQATQPTFIPAFQHHQTAQEIPSPKPESSSANAAAKTDDSKQSVAPLTPTRIVRFNREQFLLQGEERKKNLAADGNKIRQTYNLLDFSSKSRLKYNNPANKAEYRFK